MPFGTRPSKALLSAGNGITPTFSAFTSAISRTVKAGPSRLAQALDVCQIVDWRVGTIRASTYMKRVTAGVQLAIRGRRISMARRRRELSSAAAIDAHVGRRIRECRIILGLTQRQLAEMIGISNRQANMSEGSSASRPQDYLRSPGR